MLHAPREAQRATFTEKDATMNATSMQPTVLKALSIAILERNRQRNQGATAEKNNATLTLENRQQSCEVRCTISLADTPFIGAAEIITPDGESVWIAIDPEAVKLIPSGAVFFLGGEIMQLQKAGKEAARAALMVKQVFSGAGPVEIEQLTRP
jgi:hypothetical protein